MEYQTAADPIIRVENLTKIYGSGETAVRALDRLTVEVQAGEFVAVMGPSGCGKSTLLNMLGALDQPSEGKVWVASEDLSQLKDVDRFRAQTVGFVFQLHNLLPTMTAQENVEVPLQGQINSRRERKARAAQLLELVGLGDRSDHLPGQLSGGQRQRVAIARSLANNPALILADEPSGSLDSQSSDEIMAQLGELNRKPGNLNCRRDARPPRCPGDATHPAHAGRQNCLRSPHYRPTRRRPAHVCPKPVRADPTG